MPLNKSEGNMYPFVDWTWNPIKGVCLHDCVYCYMKKWKLHNAIHIDEKEMRTDLYPRSMPSGEALHTKIFVGSSTDMFAADVDTRWIHRVLDHCTKFMANQYLFQSKDHRRLLHYKKYMPPNHRVAVTIESDIDLPQLKNGAPRVMDRLVDIKEKREKYGNLMISIEPVMRFSESFAEKIVAIKPDFVSIGADSQGHDLPEPSPESLYELLARLEYSGIEVFQKKNLSRLFKNG